MKDFIAHINEFQISQSLDDHLKNVAKICSENASKIGLSKAGELIGLLHDIGKYSNAFQNYIKSASGLINQDADDFIDSDKVKGKIDHSTAGAQLLREKSIGLNKQKQIVSQLLSLCIVSHHSGLIDCLTSDGVNNFFRRINTQDERSHLTEVNQNVDIEIENRIQELLNEDLFKEVLQLMVRIANDEKSEIAGKTQFLFGLIVKFLFSCLIDGDRADTANFANSNFKSIRPFNNYIPWEILIARLEKRYQDFELKPNKNKIDIIRKTVSDCCRDRASDPTGVFTLTVPTGGGKTLSSLRFALYHAQKHRLDRIIFVIPYTTIIDQNAQVVREILEERDSDHIVLEHHSNLVPELQDWKQKILSENWDAPIIYTTNVQFFETFFGSGTRNIRRLHQLANSVIIFDEIQALPVRRDCKLNSV